MIQLHRGFYYVSLVCKKCVSPPTSNKHWIREKLSMAVQNAHKTVDYMTSGYHKIPCSSIVAAVSISPAWFTALQVYVTSASLNPAS